MSSDNAPASDDTTLLLVAAVLAVLLFFVGFGDVVLDAASTGIAALFLLFAYLTRYVRGDP